MDPTPFLIIGMFMGSAATLAIQFFANRKVKKAVAQVSKATNAELEELRLQRRETSEMRHRLAVLEQIITDQPRRLETEIEGLR